MFKRVGHLFIERPVPAVFWRSVKRFDIAERSKGCR